MHNKEAVAMLEERRSVRTYKGDQISEDELKVLERIMTNVPTHHNTQMVHFTVVQRKDLLDEMAEKIRQIMLKGNESQVKKASTPGYSPLHHAPTVIFISGDLKADFHVQTECGIAAGQIVSAAAVMGLAGCITASSLFMFRGEEGEEIKKTLGIPENYHTVCSIAIGYLDGENPECPDKIDKVNYIA